MLLRGYLSDFSFRGAEAGLMAHWGEILEATVAPEQREAGQKLILEFEGARQGAMARYEEEGVRPFQPAPPALDDGSSA